MRPDDCLSPRHHQRAGALVVVLRTTREGREALPRGRAAAPPSGGVGERIERHVPVHDGHEFVSHAECIFGA